MKIKKIEITNWRSIVHERIEIQDLMIFIGQNNHGKSNILSALLFFFGQINVDELDYYGNSNMLWVEIQFTELTDQDRVTFKKYLASDNSLMVRKTANKETGTIYNGYVEQPTLEWLREENVSNYTNRESVNATPLVELVPSTGRITKEILREAQVSYIEAHRTELEFNYILELTPFLGAKNVAKGIFGEIFHIPSVRNASDELNTRGNTLFSQLYSRVINIMSENNAAFITAKNNIVTLTKILNKNTDDGQINEDRPEELTLLERNLDEELQSWSASIDIEITPPNVDDIFRLGAKVWIDDGVKTDIERKGHGLQRAMIFALLKSWARIVREEREASVITSDESSTASVISRRASQTSFFIFEEPELFLHPQAQKELFASLVELSTSNNQVMLCTHSSSFLDLEYHRSICIVKKESFIVGTKVLQCLEDIFEGDDEKRRFNMVYWINPDRSELFFAKKVILVEGPTDKTIIPLIARKLGVFRYDYTIIDCGSKDSIPSYIKLLNKFRIQYVAVYDLDHQTGKTPEAINSADIASRLIEEIIVEALGNSVVLINDIEEEIGLPGTSRNKPFLAARHVDPETYLIPESFREKLESIYS